MLCAIFSATDNGMLDSKTLCWWKCENNRTNKPVKRAGAGHQGRATSVYARSGSRPDVRATPIKESLKINIKKKPWKWQHEQQNAWKVPEPAKVTRTHWTLYRSARAVDVANPWWALTAAWLAIWCYPVRDASSAGPCPRVLGEWLAVWLYL